MIDFFNMPGPWYDRLIGNVHVIVLNSNNVSAEQTEWLQQTISSSRARWKLVIVHKPPYDCGRYDGTPEVRNLWAPIFSRRVDLVLSGHDHNYQRFEALDDVTYVITGGGGDSLYGLSDECQSGTPARLAGNDSINHFLAIRASRDDLDVWAIGADGSVIDHFTIH